MARKTKPKCNHPHTLALQAEIQTLRATQGTGLSGLMQIREFRRLAELLAQAWFQAEVGKGGSVAVGFGTRKLGPGDSDGIVTLGEHIVIPGYAASSRTEAGVYGNVIGLIRRTVSDMEALMDGSAPKRQDTSVRCGLTACEGKNRRQNPSVKFCAWCGREFTREAIAV